MMAGSDSQAVAGGSARHVPVLARRVIDWLAVRAGGIYVDATFGAGGYTSAILATPGAHVIGIDRDHDAMSPAQSWSNKPHGTLTLVEERFSDLAAALAARGVPAVDGVVFDLGVSSMQLDEAARGFSFRFDGPLDMRMEQNGPSAADVVASADERDLAAIMFVLGEERHSRAIARAIVQARAERPIDTTRALADIVARVVPCETAPSIRPRVRSRRCGFSSMTNSANSLTASSPPNGRSSLAGDSSRRLPLARGPHRQDLPHRAEPPAGRFAPSAAVAAEPPSFTVLTRRPKTPDDAEIAANPRARSARLRAAEHTDAPPHTTAGVPALPRVPSLAAIMRGRSMILRILNLAVIVALILAAAYVYRIKFNSTVQAERLTKIRSQVRRERDTIAALRAQWGELDNPARIGKRWPNASCRSSPSRRRNSISSTICPTARRTW